MIEFLAELGTMLRRGKYCPRVPCSMEGSPNVYELSEGGYVRSWAINFNKL